MLLPHSRPSSASSSACPPPSPEFITGRGRGGRTGAEKSEMTEESVRRPTNQQGALPTDRPLCQYVEGVEAAALPSNAIPCSTAMLNSYSDIRFTDYPRPSLHGCLYSDPRVTETSVCRTGEGKEGDPAQFVGDAAQIIQRMHATRTRRPQCWSEARARGKR